MYVCRFDGMSHSIQALHWLGFVRSINCNALHLGWGGVGGWVELRVAKIRGGLKVGSENERGENWTIPGKVERPGGDRKYKFVGEKMGKS